MRSIFTSTQLKNYAKTSCFFSGLKTLGKIFRYFHFTNTVFLYSAYVNFEKTLNLINICSFLWHTKKMKLIFLFILVAINFEIGSVFTNIGTFLNFEAKESLKKNVKIFIERSHIEKGALSTVELCYFPTFLICF